MSARKKKGQLWVGTSGWSYPHWRGVLYPPEAKSAEWLRIYAGTFRTVELNASFYHMPRPETFRKQAAQTPEGFLFAVKAHRSITHEMRLAGAMERWAEFVSSAMELGAKLGPVLLQFPPSFRAQPELLEEFLSAHAADRQRRALRLAFEFRHASWFAGAVADILHQHGAALVLADSSRYPQAPLEPQGAFVYLRFHGPAALFASSYSEAQLEEWAARIRGWLGEGRDVYAYFNNDAGGCAVRNALRLGELAAR
jgi:uncharacterized protein YecE (DUF72 family)